MTTQFRGIRYIVPFLVQAWLFITPIAYPSCSLSEPWRTLYGINPMAGVVEGFRRMEKTFADVVQGNQMLDFAIKKEYD